MRLRREADRASAPGWALREERWGDAVRWAEANGWDPIELLEMRRDAKTKRGRT
jgi:hypothetical protein